ncbi:hypothetical protein [Mammaliicoccus stepanovicii]|uniref:Uncharacterized protein n=1 Tax=Mammaliicoccus stepanovicii TaxID=643214 RepID=A0A239ZQF1_9STAP|nr:hypothetical protein [Mammaliicoccus stepanovicii]PNZ76932.1 hypothetical protein CD111_05480 [Mammaliicoccus stepanovicii]GGI41343.1 hypothetical protein GCM10010896_12880 [Mammaliicoccus stepanovicii]SNV73305.1 Uncharacterised protein [Mammaliicoccus stepanovicii]
MTKTLQKIEPYESRVLKEKPMTNKYSILSNLESQGEEIPGQSLIQVLDEKTDQSILLSNQKLVDQVIYIVTNKEILESEIFQNLIQSSHARFIFQENMNILNSIRAALKFVSYSYVSIQTEISSIEQLDKEQLNPYSKIVYVCHNQAYIPTFLLKQLPLNYNLDQYALTFVESCLNSTAGVSVIKLKTAFAKSLNAIKHTDEVDEVLRTIESIYKEIHHESFDVYKHFYANQLIDLLNNYIQTHQNEEQEILNKIYQQFEVFNYAKINQGKATTLVIAYCFPPFMDTSGNVMAKRIAQEQEICDVISNDMSRIRSKDLKLTKISEKYIDAHYLLKAKQAFSSWESIEGFMDEGLDMFNNTTKSYQTIYSRAMFPQSHFLAYEIKLTEPTLNWRAEFSDPLHSTVTSEVRYSPIKDEAYIERIKQTLKPEYRELVDDNVFNCCELMAFSHADELIFTNAHQLEYMLERFESDVIRNSVKERAIISRHPTPNSHEYYQYITAYEVFPEMVNLGYFGNFYSTRGFREIELLCKYLTHKGVENFRIHCFTNITKQVRLMHQRSDFRKYIKLAPYVGYYEFLNITTQFDALILYDAHTKGIKNVNPYIPSKLSDYKGSGSNIWAFVEKDSVMSKDNNIIKTEVTDYEHFIDGFRKIENNINKRIPTN